jgi:hypothetical protein
MVRAFGGYGERVTQPGEIILAIKRAIKVIQEGTPALLEFITAKEIQYSIFRYPSRRWTWMKPGGPSASSGLQRCSRCRCEWGTAR